MASYFGRKNKAFAKQMRYINGNLNCIYVTEPGSRYDYRFSLTKDIEYNSYSVNFISNAEMLGKTVSIRKDVGNNIIITDNRNVTEDLLNAFQSRYAAPILPEWVNYILEQAIRKHLVYRYKLNACTSLPTMKINVPLPDHSVREYDLSEMYAYNLAGLMDETFEEIILDGLNRDIVQRPIGIAQQPQLPVVHDSMDHYMTANSGLLKDAVRAATEPLAPINGTVEEVALKNKILFSQQGAMVNAANTLLRRRNNVFFLEGMGVGKTLQSLATVLRYAVDNAIKKYPKKSLAEIYKQGLYTSFVWVMCPGQLCEKWKREAENEIPHLTATVIYNFADAVKAVRYENEEGRNANGIRLYIISKDTAKLGYNKEPVPIKPKLGLVKHSICKTCYENSHENRERMMQDGHLQKTCPYCDGTEWMLYSPELERFKNQEYSSLVKKLDKGNYVWGLACPHCGELLLKNKATDYEREAGLEYLTEFAMAKHTTNNNYCMLCGQSLWGPDVKNVKVVLHKSGETVMTDKTGRAIGKETLMERERIWNRVTHFSTFQRSSRTTIFARAGHEEEALAVKRSGSDFPKDGIEISDTFGPRRYPIAEYIKKHCRKADFVILDEVHKYANESGQGHAAHCLIRASKKSLSLTGTVSNGKASSLFHLLWFTEPNFMRSEGYTYASESRFISDYGTNETTYAGEYSEDEDVEYGTVVKSKAIGGKREQAGLSPILHLKMLGMGVFLDLNDFSQSASDKAEGGKLPPLQEITRFAQVDTILSGEYNTRIQIFRQNARKYGRKILAKSYNFSLFFLDKPFGRKPVMNPVVDKTILVDMPIWSEVEFDQLVGGMTNKERLLIEDITAILEKGERAFIFCENTGKESNILPRLKRIICKYTGVGKDEVQAVDASVPISEREAWIAKTAEKHNVRVFLCNPALTDTGIDFIFHGEKNGKEYNYNNILFYQLGMSVATQWQASRRAYRLNQSLPCKVIYYAYEETAQATALELMGLKIASVSATQGRFSSSALAAMSANVDPRVKLAEALMKGKVASTDEINRLFEEAKDSGARDCIYDGWTPARGYYELIGEKPEEEEQSLNVAKTDFSMFDAFIRSEEIECGQKETLSAEEGFAALFLGSFEFLVPKKKGAKKKNKKPVFSAADITEFNFGF